MGAALCKADASALLVVDVQERLFATMGEGDRTRLIHRAGQLLGAAEALGIPVIATQQYTKGLGPTVAAIADALPDAATRLEKTAFSCCGADGFMETLTITGRRQIIVAGIETHICVNQTCLELHGEGYEVFLAEDASCSRQPANAVNAAARMRQAGVVVTNAESVIFEWMRDSSHAQFKTISKLLK